MAALFGLIGVLIAIPLVSLAVVLVETLWIEPQEARASREHPPAVTATVGAP
jgi:predicted PurR-regulated permease PerM